MLDEFFLMTICSSGKRVQRIKQMVFPHGRVLRDRLLRGFGHYSTNFRSQIKKVGSNVCKKFERQENLLEKGKQKLFKG